MVSDYDALEAIDLPVLTQSRNPSLVVPQLAGTAGSTSLETLRARGESVVSYTRDDEGCLPDPGVL